MTESVIGSGVSDSASLLTNIANTGRPNASDGTVEIDIAVMVLAGAPQNEQYTLEIDINGLGKKSVTFTVGTAAVFPVRPFNKMLQNGLYFFKSTGFHVKK